ncbi:MAG: hypothetical protein JHC95_02785 [Solirubrobacteraceae bacterium]|nr:hypothetical protein [Solirubrobacteraceae bacterium]
MTIRIGPKVRKLRAESAARAVDLLEDGLVGAEARREEINALTRTYSPQQQVAARGEIASARFGGTRAGVDIRGDGSSEAYTGKVTRRLIEQQDGESAFDALRRTLG